MLTHKGDICVTLHFADIIARLTEVTPLIPLSHLLDHMSGFVGPAAKFHFQFDAARENLFLE